MPLITVCPPDFDVGIDIKYATSDNFTGKPVLKHRNATCTVRWQMRCICDLEIDESKINIEGGGCHPLGASGARIAGKAATLLHKHKAKYALATMCVGGGQGIATLFERI